MPVVQSALGIVVGGLDYGEADRIVTLLTRERGRLKGIARNAKKSRRRFGAALDLLTKVEVRFVERAGADLARLEGCDVVDAYAGLKEDLGRLTTGSYAAELAREAAPDEERSEALFDLLDAFLRRLARGPFDPGLVRQFEVRALAVLGWRPELGRCAVCGAPLPEDRPVAFSPARGGAVCASCGGPREWVLSPGTRRMLEAALAGQRVAFTPAALEESDGPIAAFVERHLGRRLRSRELLGRL